MVIPTPLFEDSESVAVGSSASSIGNSSRSGMSLGVGVTASIPIPTTPMSMPNPNSTKLSSSAPGDKLVGFELLRTAGRGMVLAASISNSPGISSFETGLQQQQRSRKQSPPSLLTNPTTKTGTAGLDSGSRGIVVTSSTPLTSITTNVTTTAPTIMDLEPSDKVLERSSSWSRRKYTDSDLPPHLLYSDRNVIAILNRCDPERGRRCYSCGYDNTDKWLSNNQNNGYEEANYGYFGQRNSISDDEPYSWTFQHGGGSGTGGGYFYNEPQQIQQQPPPPPSWNYNYFEGDDAFYNNHHQQPIQMNMSESGEGRRRFYSDGGSGSNTNSDLDLANAMDDEEVFTFDARLLSEAFLSSGRVDHTIQLMAYHPDYLEIFLRTHHFLMRGDGPLPYNHRNYIAIMAAARYQCSYLMELQKREFLYQGGDPKWLRGLESAPAKLLALYQINKIMAHRPWVLRKEDFLHLTKKAGWSLSEVVQAVVILAHFHALSSFIHGCGITPEIDFEKGHSYMDPGNFNSIRSVSEALHRSSHHEMGEAGGEVKDSTASPDTNSSTTASPSVSFAMDQPTSYFGSKILPNPSERGKQTKSILKKTEVGSSTSPTANNSNTNTNSNISPNSNSAAATANNNHLLKDATHHTNSLIGTNNSPPKPKGLGSSVSEVEIIMATMKNLSESGPIEDPEERKKRFENVASSDDSQEGKENLLSHSLGKSSSSIPPEISPFVCDPDFIYEDFAKRGQVSEMHTFRIQDYSWEEHGYSLVNRLYNEVGVYLDEKFKLASSLTYYTMGGRTQVDTTKFRTAVWNYIQCLYGIRHDDYDYGEVNQLLERPLKAYIKTVCCFPERITKADYDNVMREFKHSEKVHVNLMIMEAKIQAELLYALRTIMRFLI